MNKKILALGVAVLVIASVFVGCTKTNVKNGNKRIVGTWNLTAETSVSSYESNSSYDFSDNICDQEDYTTKNSSTSNDSFTGTTLTTTSTSSYTGADGVTDTHSSTETYTYSSEVTFNEDGTFTMKSNTEGTDENDNPVIDKYEMTGHWSWVDAAETKIGIQLEGDYSLMNIYIETLDKEELVLNFEDKYMGEDTYTTVDAGYCYDENYDYVYYDRTYVGTSTSTSSGTQTFAKKAE